MAATAILERSAAVHVAGRESDTAYLSLHVLRKLGSIRGRPLGSSFNTARWREVLDGMLIFREERSPDFIRR